MALLHHKLTILQLQHLLYCQRPIVTNCLDSDGTHFRASVPIFDVGMSGKVSLPTSLSVMCLLLHIELESLLSVAMGESSRVPVQSGKATNAQTPIRMSNDWAIGYMAWNLVRGWRPTPGLFITTLWGDERRKRVEENLTGTSQDIHFGGHDPHHGSCRKNRRKNDQEISER